MCNHNFKQGDVVLVAHTPDVWFKRIFLTYDVDSNKYVAKTWPEYYGSCVEIYKYCIPYPENINFKATESS